MDLYIFIQRRLNSKEEAFCDDFYALNANLLVYCWVTHAQKKD